MLQLTTPPTQEPITLSEAKSHARIFISADDSFINDLISAARQKFEQEAGYLVSQATYTWTIAARHSMSIDLPVRPVIAVASVGDLAEEDYTLTIDAATGIGTITLATGITADKTEIVFTAGSPDGEGSAAPALAKLAIRSLIAHYYNQREAYATGQLVTVPATYESIVRNFRIA